MLSPRSDNNGNSIGALYNNICSVNERHGSQYGTKWKVDISNDAAAFVTSNQDSEIGIFLATQIDFNPFDINIDGGNSDPAVNHAGFLNFGHKQLGKKQSVTINIAFLRSNWDMADIFFDRWIAAIGQQGLIEADDLPNIKATIIIQEYAVSVPNGTAGVWFPRKQITISKAYPYNRANVEYSYSEEKAGVFKDQIVKFQAESYTIKYNDLP